MTDHEFENYLTLLRGLLRLRDRQSQAVTDELRDHLEDRLDDLVQQGMPREEAVAIALNEFGDAAGLAAEFSAISRNRKRRWIMRMTVGTMAGSILIAIVAASLWPDPDLNPMGPQAALADPVDGADSDTSNRRAESDAAANPKPAAPPSPYSEKIKLGLKKTVDVAYDELPLEEVVAHLSTASGIRLMLDQRALAYVGFSSKLPVTLRLPKVSVRAAISHVARQCRLAYLPADGGIVLTTPDQREMRQQTLVYPVWDLVKRRGPEGAPHAVYEPLEQLIEQLIHPSTWQNEGGQGTLAHYDGVLVISQSSNVHVSVGELLAMLRTLPTVDEARQGTPEGSAEERPAEHQRVSDQVVVRPPQPWVKNLERKLAETIDLNVVNKPLGEWIAELAAEQELPIVLDRPALEDIGIGPETPITRKLSGVTLQSALRLILRELDLNYVLVDEAVLITTPEVLQSEAVVRLFPVGDLVWADRDPSPSAIEAGLAKLTDLIQQTIGYDSWDHFGGLGAMKGYSQRAVLVSHQLPEIQQQIARLLGALRRAKALETAGPGPATLQQTQQRIVTTVYNLFLVDGAEPIEPSDLEELIGRVVEPQSWEQDDVYLKALPGRIVVRHQTRVHQMVRRLLADLRMVPFKSEGQMDAEGGGLGGGGGFF